MPTSTSVSCFQFCGDVITLVIIQQGDLVQFWLNRTAMKVQHITSRKYI